MFFETEAPAFTEEIGLIPLSEEFLVHSMWADLFRAPDGSIYVAGGNHETFAADVWLFRFDPATGQVRVCVSLAETLGVRVSPTAVGESKVHTRIFRGKNGRFYMGTMQGGIAHLSKLPHYWHPDQYEGGHLFEHDPASGQTVDLGIPVRGDGLQAGAMDYERNILYFITWPRKRFVKYDLNTRTVTLLGVLTWCPSTAGGDKQNFGRDLMISDDGRVYSTNNFGCLVRFDPQKGILEDTDILVRKNDSLRCHVKTGDGLIYLVTSLGYLIRFDPREESVEELGPVSPQKNVYTPNLTINAEETKLVYLAGSHGSYVGAGPVLYEFDIRNRSYEQRGTLDPRFFPSFCYGSCVDVDGRYVFAVHGAEPPNSYLAVHDPRRPEKTRWLVQGETRAAKKFFYGTGSEGHTRGWIATDYHLLTRSSGGEIPHDRCAITSLAAGTDGYIYGATSAVRGKTAYLFRSDGTGRYVEILGDLGQVLGSAQSVRRSLICAADGCIYGGTIDLIEDRFTQKSALHDSPPCLPSEYGGGHLFRYNPAEEKLEDLGVPAEAQGIYAMCLSPDKSVVYALSFPHATLISLDIETGRVKKEIEVYHSETPGLLPDEFSLAMLSVTGEVECAARKRYLIEKRKLGRGVEEIPDEMLLKKYYVSRAIVCDSAGRIYGSHGEGKMFRYDPGTGALDLLEEDFPIFTGTEYGLISETSIESLVRTGDGVIYGGTCQDGYLFRLDAENGEITNLGKPVMQGRIRALCVWKADLYGIAGEDLGIAHLFSYNLKRGGFTELGVLQGGGKTGFAVNICDSIAAGPQGRLYIGQSERISALLSIRDIRYEPYQSP